MKRLTLLIAAVVVLCSTLNACAIVPVPVYEGGEGHWHHDHWRDHDHDRW
ncbi:MAG: hypothetical protein JO218_06245 [Burkholderiales bacterium]|nr:hypothetical protein [Burkholderiales bacterium]